MFFKGFLFLAILVAVLANENVNGRTKKLRCQRTLGKTEGSPYSTPLEGNPRDCAELWYSGVRSSGVYRIWPEDSESFEVYCDMTTDGGGWTVFQKRGQYGNPQDYFYKSWVDYRTGFGDLKKEFWLGNEKIFSLTNQDLYELRVDLKDTDKNRVYAKYSSFKIESEKFFYKLKIGGYSGDAGDGMDIHRNMMFTTKDRKHDNKPWNENCAVMYGGAWWYNKCHHANLNGLNLRGSHGTNANGINWFGFRGEHYSLAATEMKVRPATFYTRPATF